VSDDLLSFSTTSFDSARCMTESDPDSSSDEDEKPGDEGDSDDLSSDWDWSSGDEDDRVSLTTESSRYNFFYKQLSLGSSTQSFL